MRTGRPPVGPAGLEALKAMARGEALRVARAAASIGGRPLPVAVATRLRFSGAVEERDGTWEMTAKGRLAVERDDPG